MEIIITEDSIARSSETTKRIVQQVKVKPDLIIIFPADTTHEGMYSSLSDLCRKRKISFRKATAFQLDEYIGINENNPSSFRRLLKDKLFSQTDFKTDNIHFLNADAENAEKACQNYEQELAQVGPADLCILGIGQNGHIAFNEPGTDPELGVHVTKLDQETIRINRCSGRAITLGIKNILSSKKIILSASGLKKAQAVKAAIEGLVSSDCPASFLKNHPDVTFIIDKDAASLLEK